MLAQVRLTQQPMMHTMGMSVKELGRPSRPILEWDEVDVNDLYKDPAEDAKVEAKAAEPKEAKQSFWDRLRGAKK